MPAPTARRTILLWLVWTLALGVLLTVLVPVRESVGQTHAALGILLIVLGASATLGFTAGISMAIGGFALLTYFFKTPLDTLSLADSLDLVELIAFATVAFVAARLLTMARDRAELAEARSQEIERLARERTALALEAAQARSLAEANRMKDALLATVSHDLRTPLTTIRTLAERRSVSDDDDWNLVQQETARLSHLVRELLDFSRIRGGALPVSLETYPAEDLVGAVSRECRGRLASLTLRVDLPMSGEILAGTFDLALATRVLANLVENAAKYGTEHTTITLAVRRDGAMLHFSVENVGTRIAVSDRERIFEPFTRAGTALAQSRVVGVGLGLAIARALAEAQHGTVVLQDGSDNTTRFVLSLPAVDWNDAVLDADQPT
jgi:two-component system sensor histidine kinase KdpD